MKMLSGPHSGVNSTTHAAQGRVSVYPTTAGLCRTVKRPVSGRHLLLCLASQPQPALHAASFAVCHDQTAVKPLQQNRPAEGYSIICHSSLQPDSQVPEPEDQPGSPDPLRTDQPNPAEGGLSGGAQQQQKRQQPQQQPVLPPYSAKRAAEQRAKFDKIAAQKKSFVPPKKFQELKVACEQKQAVGDKLVKRLQAVRDQLTEASKVLGLVPETPTPVGLPLGAFIDEDGCMRCSHGELVWSRVANRKGPNKGSRFYRCPIFTVRDCFWKTEEELSKLSAEALGACQKSFNYYETNKGACHRLNKDVRTGVFKLPAVGKGFYVNDAVAKEETGYWGEAFMFKWLQLALPGFDDKCWVSAGRRCLDRPPDDPDRWRVTVDFSEPSHDFEYVDKDGVLGTPDARYKFDAKSTRGVAVQGGKKFKQYNPIFVTANEWAEMTGLFQDPSKGTYVILSIDRVHRDFQGLKAPRLAAVLVDPYGMRYLKPYGTIRVVDAEPDPTQPNRPAVKVITKYPAQPEVLTTDVYDK